ncbi:MAG: MerC domain-containing protein [Pseudomonadota bacterium]
MRTNAAVLDKSAIGLSGLCLIHCLALPFLSAFLPLAGLVAEAEWIHKLFVLMAVPITLTAIMRNDAVSVRIPFVLTASVGLALLIAAAFIEGLHDYETTITTTGAVLLASAHVWRWANNHGAAE